MTKEAEIGIGFAVRSTDGIDDLLGVDGVLLEGEIEILKQGCSDRSTGPLARLFARSLAPLTRSLAPLTRSLAPSLVGQ